MFEGLWQRVLHDHTADHIAAFVDQLPNVNATIVPFQLGKRRKQLVPWKAGGAQGSHALHDAEFGTLESSKAARAEGAKTAAERMAGLQSPSTTGLSAGAVPIGNLRARQPASLGPLIASLDD